jgi:hypothetical protein
MEKVLKSKFGWNVLELDPYTDQESQDLVVNEVLSAETLSLISTESDVKFKKKLKKLDVEVNWQDGESCGFEASGDVDFTDREIQTYPIKLNLKFCNLDLIGTWAQKALRAGAINELEELPYRDLVTTHILSKQALEVEKAIWNSNIANGVGNLSFFDGLETVIASESANMIDINTNTYSTFTSSNAFDVLWAAYNDMSASDLGQAVLERGAIAWLTRNQYNALIKNIVDLNQYNFDPTRAAADKTFELPGTDLIIRRINGRNDDTKFYIANGQNLVFGTDLASDALDLKMWYNEDEEEIRFKLRMRAGTEIRKPEEIGYFELDTNGGE